jgi:hypothetical protein
MAHYYFDFREADELIPNEEGLELRDMKVMQKEAARAVAGFARDSVQSLKAHKAIKWQSRCVTNMAP